MKTMNLNAILILSLVVFIFASCKKDQEPMVLAPQNVTVEYLDSLASPINTLSTGQNYSVGYQFRPKINGKITELSVNLPNAGDYKISIWDVDTQTLLTQTTINQAYGNWANKDIPDLTLEAQKTYAISFLLPATDYYYVDNLTLPVDMANITIINSIAAIGDGYPVDQTFTDHLFGFVDLTFQADPQ